MDKWWWSMVCLRFDSIIFDFTMVEPNFTKNKAKCDFVNYHLRNKLNNEYPTSLSL